ncbi:MAG TPA: ABC transporter substrate-binding protein [Streptosporangiaceae bacterium]|nr:ABC transporter substrate-binding protein [Streptosporangiaceae bacterium]
MKHRVLAALAVASALSIGIAACGSSGSSKGGGHAATGKTLVIESTPLSPMTDTFNPFSLTSTGFLTNAVALYNEPLYIFNTLNSAQPPIPMLATNSTFSNGGKTLTLTIRQGVKWNDGKAFSASDVAFTFNLLKNNPKLNTNGAPVVTSASAPNATTAVLNFAAPEYANLFLIGQVYIVPQHVWASVGDPATYADASPVGTGPFMLDKFSPQGYTLKQNPYYWQKSKVHVPAISFPAYNTNANLVPPVASGQIDFAGNYISNIKANYLDKSPDNHTWLNSAPYFSANNVVGLFLNVTKAPLNDPAVRQAISYGINRQQLNEQGETGYEPPVTNSGGLLLPNHQSFLDPSLANNLPATGDPAKVTSTLKADGWTMTGGKWTKNGQKITFAVSDPVPYSDYYTNAQLIAHQLNAQGFNVTVNGIGNPTVWAGDVANGTFDATIRWSNQGPNPYFIYDTWMDSSLTAKIGSPAAGDFGRFNNPQAQAALAQFAGSGDTTVQADAIKKLQQIMTTQVPVVPLMNGGAWAQVSTRNYTGWPTAANPYMNPVPNTPYLEVTILHLTPKS